MSDPDSARGPSVRVIPEGDDRERMVCADCGFVLYDNPKIVVGSVARWGERSRTQDSRRALSSGH